MRKIVFIFVAVVFLITLGSIQGTAYKRPPNPVMNYVPQNVGIYDTYYGNFKETDCRACHGDSEAVSNRHHYSALVFADCPDGCPLPLPNCLAVCHVEAYNPVTNPTGDCNVCHVDGTWIPIDVGYGIGNLGLPHHRSDLAGSGQCTACHEPSLLVEPKSVKPPFYYPVAYTHTPTPYNCENCHWPSGNAPEGPPLLIDWNSWIGLPKPTTWPDGLSHPAPIEANGPLLTGSVVAGDPAPTANKLFRPNNGTHHEIDGRVVYAACWLCHAGDSDSGWDPTNPLLIRYCENCHSKDSLHGIEDHVTTGQGLTVNQKCAACHGVVPNASPVSGPVKPVIKYISPSFGPAGTLCFVHGENFGSSGDILLTPRMGETDQTLQISSGDCTWTNDLIVFNVPLGLPNRNYNLKVETPNGISNIQVFTLTGRPPCIACPTLVPNIDSMEPLLGAENSLLTITGHNFGDRHTSNRNVLLIQNSATVQAPILSWTDNKIQFRFPTWQVTPGTVSVKVKTENGESNQKDFELRKTFLDAWSMDHPSTGILRLSYLGPSGFGFGDSMQYVRPDGYGWVSSVALNHPNGTIPVSSDSIINWSDTEIKLTLPAIQFDFYGVTVETTYFFDLDGNGVYTPGIDTTYQTVTGDPQLFRPVECNLVPDTTSIKRGGTLGFQATGTNYTNNTGSVLFASKVTLPSGNWYPSSGYLFGPLSFSLGSYQSKSKHLSQAIPSNAPLGTYTYHGYLGNYGVGIYDECTFTFTVTSP